MIDNLNIVKKDKLCVASSCTGKCDLQQVMYEYMRTYLEAVEVLRLISLKILSCYVVLVLARLLNITCVKELLLSGVKFISSRNLLSLKASFVTLLY